MSNIFFFRISFCPTKCDLSGTGGASGANFLQPCRGPKVLKQLQLHPVAHSMMEHVALADHVEEHGEAGHLAEAGPL